MKYGASESSAPAGLAGARTYRWARTRSPGAASVGSAPLATSAVESSFAGRAAAGALHRRAPQRRADAQRAVTERDRLRRAAAVEAQPRAFPAGTRSPRIAKLVFALAEGVPQKRMTGAQPAVLVCDVQYVGGRYRRSSSGR
jgi:hypothetical protein